MGESPLAPRGDQSRSEQGATLVLFGLWLVMIFGFGALSLDVARIYNEHSEL